MKKMLVLMLILALSSWAGAVMTLQISANGEQNPVNSQINLVSSQTATLGIWSPEGWGSDDTDNVYWGLVIGDASVGLGTISGGVVHMPPAPDLSELLPAAQNDPYFSGHDGIYGQFMCSSNGGTSGTFVDQILFHCDGPDDVVVQLWLTRDDYETTELQDTLIIHQIPEPATMFLLGIGGFFFRKFRK